MNLTVGIVLLVVFAAAPSVDLHPIRFCLPAGDSWFCLGSSSGVAMTDPTLSNADCARWY
jgi:hypothetical protein